jgi:Mn2+/Fe2+ NRAMP family transporter
VPPNSLTASAGLVSPEAQITSETSVAGYLNFMRIVVGSGAGSVANGARDVQPDYSAELALATNPDALVDRINLLLAAGKLSATTRNTIRDAVAAVTIRSTAPQSDTDKRNRVLIAIYLTLASTDYILQN